MLQEVWSSRLALKCCFTCINIMFLGEGKRQNFSTVVQSLKCEPFGVLTWIRDFEVSLIGTHR